jgi:hypothetical protein
VSVKAYPPDSPGRAQEIPTVNTPGGAGGTIATQDEGISVDAAATTLNFVGAGVTATDAGSNVTTVTIPGGSGAPVDAEYVVMSLNGTLTNERRLQATSPIVLTDGGANADATLTHATAGTAGTYGGTSTIPVITTNATGHVTNVTTATPTLGFAAIDLFGNGDDGAFTYDGATTPAWASRSGSIYTLTRSVAHTDATVNVGVEVRCANANMFVSGTLTNNGRVHNDGRNASGVSAGAFTGVLFWQQTGQGSAGAGTTAPGAPGSITANALGSAGGAGGSSPSGAGANGGTVTIPTASNGGIQHALTLMGAWMGRCNAGSSYGGGGGGGGARGDAGGSGGGGGAGGGIMALFVRELAGNGTISCDGGDGGAPSVASTNAGGGGGGGGGVVFLTTKTANPGSVNTITAAGGIGGTGKGTGTNGTDGTAGRTILLRVAT